MSGGPSEDRYRISVKREPQGAAGAYIDTRVQAGDILDVSALRGNFTLRQSERLVDLVSAGIGATPSSLCCTHWPPSKLEERFGGFTVPATAASIHLRRRCVSS
jgi:ferredoxin-NADP reductase